MSQHPWTHHDKVIQTGIIPAIDGDTIAVRGTILNGTGTLYTVPANKCLLLFSWNCGWYKTAAVAGNATFYLMDSTPAISQQFMYSSIAVVAEDTINQSYFLPVNCEAGSKFYYISGSANLRVTASIFGILIDV